MANKPRANKSRRIPITISEGTAEFLDALVLLGGHFGNSAGDAAAAIVEDRVVQLIKEGYLEKGLAAQNDIKQILKSKKPAKT